MKVTSEHARETTEQREATIAEAALRQGGHAYAGR